jgi:hypothetical protein
MTERFANDAIAMDELRPQGPMKNSERLLMAGTVPTGGFYVGLIKGTWKIGAQFNFGLPIWWTPRGDLAHRCFRCGWIFACVTVMWFDTAPGADRPSWKGKASPTETRSEPS